jgi:hypothetical protein
MIFWRRRFVRIWRFLSRKDHFLIAMTYRVFADFNGIASSPRNVQRIGVPLDTYGSLRGLSNLGIQLKESISIVIFDWSDQKEDIEGHCEVYYDSKSKLWWAEVDERGFLNVPRDERKENSEFLCLGCRDNLAEYFSQNGRNSETKCPSCRTSIMAAIKPLDTETPAL